MSERVPIRVTCAIIKIEGKYLVTQRSSQMQQPLKWEFPGGKIENGEDETECILREIREELNICIRVTGRLTPVTHHYANISITLIPFLAEYASGDIMLAEHCCYQLIEKSELMQFNWTDADIPIVAELMQSEF